MTPRESDAFLAGRREYEDPRRQPFTTHRLEALERQALMASPSPWLNDVGSNEIHNDQGLVVAVFGCGDGPLDYKEQENLNIQFFIGLRESILDACATLRALRGDREGASFGWVKESQVAMLRGANAHLRDRLAAETRARRELERGRP